MSSPARSVVSPSQLLSTLRRHFFVWAVPTVVLTVLAIGYAAVRPLKWRASQALVVRDEAGSSGTTRQGRFDTSEAMKTAQETLVQMSRNPTMVKAALDEAGPPIDSQLGRDWPTKADIEELQDDISISPPKGGEFGRNEVIYLSVQGPTRERAIALTEAVCNQLELELQELRRTKAQSLIAELEKGMALAQTDLAAATERLQETEKSVGRDLDELRSLTETNAGSNLRSTSNQLKEEIRSTQRLHDANAEQLKLLNTVQTDKNRLMAAPQRLFEQQPALRRLKDGLVDAQLRTAQLAGKMSANHPEVKAATLAENEIRRQLNDEIELVVRHLENDLKVSASLLKTLQQQNAEVDGRLSQVAGIRATYANQLVEVRQRSETLSKIIQDLANVRASQAAALSSSLIARLDKPQPDNGPVGPGFATIVMAGFGGGLMLGLGLVFLTAPLGNLWGRRWTDYVGIGRRASDKRAVAQVDPSRPPQRREADLKEKPAAKLATAASNPRPAERPVAKAAMQQHAAGTAPVARPSAPPMAPPIPAAGVTVVRAPDPISSVEPLIGSNILPAPLNTPK